MVFAIYNFHIHSIDSKIFVQQNSDYTTWDYDTITDWIIGLDKEFIRYEKAVRKQLNDEEITGADLIELDTKDLSRLGIKVFEAMKKTMITSEYRIHRIQKLVSEVTKGSNGIQESL